MNTSLKRCAKCGNEYPDTEKYFFWRDKTVGTLRNVCKRCFNPRKSGDDFPKTRQNGDIKTCNRCNRDYPATTEYFAKRSNRASGLQSQCKQCDKIRNKKMRTENHKQILNAQRNWRTKNRVRHNTYNRNWNRQNTVHIQERLKANPEIYRVHTQQRLARKRGKPDAFSKADWLRCIKYFNYQCAACGRLADSQHIIAMDHWIPLSHPDCPGTIPTNIIPLCHSIKGGNDGCNNAKSNRDAHEWLIFTFGEQKAADIENLVQKYFAHGWFSQE